MCLTKSETNTTELRQVVKKCVITVKTVVGHGNITPVVEAPRAVVAGTPLPPRQHRLADEEALVAAPGPADCVGSLQKLYS